MQDFPKEYFGNPFELSSIFSKSAFKDNGINFHSFDETPKKWRLYYKSEEGETCFACLQQALNRFHNVLFGIRVNKEVSLIFCITDMRKSSYLENVIPRECFKAFYVGKN